MSDRMRVPTSPPEPAGEEALAALIAQALEGEDASDEARALAEVALDLAALNAEALEPLREDVREAALAAWDAPRAVAAAAAPASQSTGAPLRVLWAAVPERLPHVLRWAAVLLVGLGVTLLAVLSSPEEATAGLRLGTFFRIDGAAGRQETTSGRRIPWGERLTSRPHEVLGFRLPDGSAVVLEDEGVLRLSRADDGRAVLALEAGTVRLVVAGSGPVRLALGARTLHLVQGRAWASARTGMLALGPTGRGRLEIPGAEAQVLEGPVEGRYTPARGFEALAGESAPDRFRMPSLLGADRLGRAPGRLVAARRWRVVGGEGRRRGTSIQPGAVGVRLGWQPSPEVRRAHTLRLRLEGSEGLEVSLPGLGVEAEPAVRRMDLALPAGWYEQLTATGEELLVDLRWAKGGRHDARFLGASFLSDAESKRRE